MIPAVTITTFALPESPLSDAELALLRFARNGEHRQMRALLEAGARLDVHDRNGRRPLTLAAESGHVATMQVLVEAGASVNERDAGKTPWTALMRAVHADETAAALALLRWGADPNAGEDSGYRPLMMAAGRGNRWLVRELLARGADPAAKLFLGFTALDYAIGYGHFEIVRILLDAAPELRTRRNPARRAVLALADDEILALLSA